MRTYGTLSFAGGLWTLKAEPHVTMMLKRVFGRVNPRRDGAIVLSDTTSTAADISWAMSRYPLVPDTAADAHLRMRLRQHAALQEEIDAIMAGDHLDFERKPSREPFSHQLAAADLAVSLGRLLLTDPLGGMKSFSGLLMLRHPLSLPALIVCPQHLATQWLDEAHESFEDLRAHILRTTKVYDPAGHRSMRGHSPDVLISTYAKLSGWSDHLAGRVRTVIFDEAQELRRVGTTPDSPTAKYAAAALLASRANFRMGLTNTPIYNYGDEIFNVLDVLEPGCLGFREEFYREWCSPIGSGKHVVNNPAALGAYLRDNHLLLGRSGKEIAQATGRKERAEPKRISWHVDADERVLAQEMGGAVDLARLIVSGAGDKETRWRASGELDWQMRRATGMAKAPYVLAFVKMLLESEAKVVVAGWHRDVYDLWTEMLRKAEIGFVMYTGSESPAAKDAALRAFVELAHYRVFMISLRSGVGLDGLERSGCRVVVFGELDWSPAVHDQVLGRLNRGDHDDEVLGYFVNCTYGSDPTILETLGVKRGQQPIVDPTVKLFEQAETGARVRRLAQAVLDNHG